MTTEREHEVPSDGTMAHWNADGAVLGQRITKRMEEFGRLEGKARSFRYRTGNPSKMIEIGLLSEAFPYVKPHLSPGMHGIRRRPKIGARPISNRFRQAVITRPCVPSSDWRERRRNG